MTELWPSGCTGHAVRHALPPGGTSRLLVLASEKISRNLETARGSKSLLLKLLGTSSLQFCLRGVLLRRGRRWRAPESPEQVLSGALFVFCKASPEIRTSGCEKRETRFEFSILLCITSQNDCSCFLLLLRYIVVVMWMQYSITLTFTE